MTRHGWCALIVVLIPRGSSAAQGHDSLSMTVNELGAHLRFLSSDLLEGRYPGTRGEALTTLYIVSQLEAFGVRPGATDGWLQPVPVIVNDSRSATIPEVQVTGRVARRLEPGRDVRVLNYSAREAVEVGGELVFVGYGISAPNYGWNDFEGLDLRGKVAIGLIGEPQLPGDSVSFNGFRASRFSWTPDKIAELARRGAVGVLWVRPAGWISTTPATAVRCLAEDASTQALGLAGSIADSTFAALLPPDAPDLGALLAAAAQPGFRGFPLQLRLEARFRTSSKQVTAHNVIGVVPGTDRALSSEHIVLSAHWDAYGIGDPVSGDSIYNGALDDGSGLTALLALARIFASHPQPRSIMFLFTFEEWGLLGAEAFVRGSPLSMDRIVANFNMDDGLELFGVKRDVAPLGTELSTLGKTVDDVAARLHLQVKPDPFPQEGFFIRADNYVFARAGVPAMYMALGTDAVGREPSWTDAKVKEYLERHYHKPGDEFATVVVDLRGSLQLATFVRDVTISVARTPQRPEWLPRTEFQRWSVGIPPKGAGCFAPM